MASQCKRQQCTIERRGFRQELDSWRHKLIHCVGFESILDGLFGPELVEDLKLFKDLEPTAVSDWSFDENCLFCCLRRDKVKEHLIGLSDEELEDRTKPLLVKDQTTISRLEKQAEEFLNAVLCRKDVPNFSDPNIPVVAREILQRMIRQFAAEYTSKTSPPQDSCSDIQPHSDQSLPTSPLLSEATSPVAAVAGPANNQNPVLSKLLMADQDAPLDLTIKKPLAVPRDQDGVLDLSIKKNRCSSSSSSSLPVRSPCLSPATSTLKGESPEVKVSKTKDLQSTSTLEHFMAKLCPHHQRQIVDAIGFLQTEVKALASSNTQQDSNLNSGIQGTAGSTAKSSSVTPEKSCPELMFPSESTPLKSEVQDMSHLVPSSCAMKKGPENAVSLKTSVTTSPALDLRSPVSGRDHAFVTPTGSPVDAENNPHGDHAPLKMKIMASNVDGKKLSCVLNTSLSSHSDTLEDADENSNSSNRTETHSARLSSSVKRHNPTSLTHHARQRETFGHAKERPAKLFSVHMTIPSDSPRTARKTCRASSDHRIRDSACRGLVDPDFGHCDIVYIDKPITECFKDKQRNMLPRRNARKSTRGHMYSDEIWELKTVRTLAGRGNCPNPMPQLITLVTPKQVLSKPEGVPPVDMPFAGRESMNQQTSTEESDESMIPGTGDMVEVAASEVDVIVETSQTDQCQNTGQSPPASPIRFPTENKETDMNTDMEHDTIARTGITTESEEIAAQAPFEDAKENNPEPQEETCESDEQMVVETEEEPSETKTTEEAEPQSSADELPNSEPVLQQSGTPSPVDQVDAEREENENESEEIKDERPQEIQPETRIHCENVEVTEQSNSTGIAEEVKEPEMKTSETVDSVMPSGTEEDKDSNFDVSSKTLDALLKELPPWRRKRGAVIPLPTRLRQTEPVVVGYVNGRPISSSDRSLRRRSNSMSSPSKSPVKASLSAPSKTSLDSAIDSNVKKEYLDKHLPDTHKPVEAVETSVSQLVKETSSETSSATSSKPISKLPSSRTTQIQKQKKLKRVLDSLSGSSNQLSDHSQGTESKRQLRSAGQRPAGTEVSPPTSNVVTSTSPPKHEATPAPSSAEPFLPPLSSTEPILPPPSSAEPFLPPPSTPPVTSLGSCAPVATEQSQQDTAPETTVELNVEKPQPEEMTSEETQKPEGDSRLQAKQKLRSAKAVLDDNTDEIMQPSGEVSIPLENQSPIKTEMQTQIMPLRSKRVLRKEADASDVSLLQKPNVASLGDKSASGDDSSSPISDRPTRMPLRSESSKPEISHQSAIQLSPGDNRKSALRSQRLAAPSTSALTVAGRQSDVASPIKIKPEKISRGQIKTPPGSVASVLPHSSAGPVFPPRSEPPKQTNKFYQTLTAEENQHLITNLNVKYDKLQKGWVQMDKEGQPVTKHKSKGDRQAAIWKSKRRARKAKGLDHQKYSPVQMLFMKGFNLTSICRWFLESTETKSLVIVKKVNTRLPSETQLCFHSSSSASGTSQGVFPSLQAERLKKHLKKFAIASPVKSNPKNQKMIAKALEHDTNTVKGKDRKELPSTTQTLAKSHSSEAVVQIGEAQKPSGKSKNPASARILRKYSNIRGKMQVQQTNVRLKQASKNLRRNGMKTLATTKSATKTTLKPSLKARKSSLPVGKQVRQSAAKLERRKKLAGKKTAKHPVQEKAAKAQSSRRASRDATKKELPKRCSQRLGSPKIPDHKSVDTSKSKIDNKKQIDAEKVEMEAPTVSKASAAKIQTKESQATVSELKGTVSAVETAQPSTDSKVPTSPDQVLTRSQRKMEAAVPLRGPPSKKAAKSMKQQNATLKSVRKAEGPALTRRSASKFPTKRSQAASLPRNARKMATKRTQELSETPAKRTRTSVSK